MLFKGEINRMALLAACTMLQLLTITRTLTESEADDPDGEPLLMEDEDPELARKRQELREIEEQIKQKRVSIALKKGEHIVNKATLDFSTNRESAECEGPTLRERVNAVLQKRHPDSLLSKGHSPKERLKSSSRSKLQDHPLKLRVKALMERRLNDPFVFSTYRQVPDITPPPPAQMETSAEKKANSFDLGFQRFLSVLNKGVDIDMLSKIVNADGEDLPVGVEVLDFQPTALKDKLDMPLRGASQGEGPPSRSESQGSNSGVSLLCHSQTSIKERKTNPHSQERSLSERFSLPNGEEKRNDRGDHCLLSSGALLPGHSLTSSAERKINPHSQERSLSQKLPLPDDEEKEKKEGRCFASSSQSKSPPAVKKKKKKKKKEEEPPKVDDHREQLQNILKTLGLSLEVEEMSKLEDRTQERLYGKKRAESREQQESQQRGSHKHFRNSFTSSSSSSNSRSTSQNSSPSSSHCRLSHSRDSNQRRSSHSRDRCRDKLTNHDSKQDSTRAQTHCDRDRDGEHSKETFTHENPHSLHPIPTYPPEHPDTFPAYTEYGFPQYSEYDEYHSNSFDATTNSFWMYPQDAEPVPFYHSEYSNSQDPFHHFAEPAAAPKRVRQLHKLSAQDTHLLVNPDLSRSEGQVGPASGTRCLRVVTTLQTTSQSCLKTLTGGKRRRTGDPNKRIWKQRLFIQRCRMGKKLAKSAKEAKRMKTVMEEKEVKRVMEEKVEKRVMEEKVEKKEASHGVEHDSETVVVKEAPTEEEIKKNLRKMLAAFNQKQKPNVIQPHNSIP
ncbi:uncharacterized protein LOC117815890 isoform X2 [Notolabrus celidotus]|uniref:uncharacterized protein LOC117815890 isoform X2 n=1 Tax=Notolabrus celidotus TaxID=1203425 RepID=UPI00148FDB44|nr:uncharacterized protein LOC117815890 isoform X2 [Notolabrus celidotus]